MDIQSDETPMVRVLCLPDIDKPIGGVKQLYRHVEHLQTLGWDAAVVTETDGFRPSWFSSSAKSIGLKTSWKLGELVPSKTILVLPETYLGVDLSSFRGFDLSNMKRVVFNQNAYYSFGDFNSNTAQDLKNFYDNSLVLQVLTVSEDSHTFLSRNLGIRDKCLSRIVNSIERSFRPNQEKVKRMHWMPRKNSVHVQAILQSLQRSTLTNTNGWQGQPLHDLAHSEVADFLNGALLFLAFGHPEGFGLPIAEAMASGCWVVGYSGGGGRELFGYGASEEVPYGDWSAFLAALQRAFINFEDSPRETFFRLQRQSVAIKTLYSYDAERDSIKVAWLRIHEQFRKA